MSGLNHFFGDEERSFILTLGGIRALQLKIGCGFGAIAKRFSAGEWHVDDLREVIRQALIGGGELPAAAEKLLQTWFDCHPLQEMVNLSAAIIYTALIGVDGDPVGKLETEKEATPSSSPTSMAQVQPSDLPQET
jgi:hypothetical protein